jgi:molecular chaperone DnaK (HSP70)
LNEIEPDDRGLVAWKVHKKAKEGEVDEDILYTEELLAMLLKYGKQLSEKQAGGTVKDCVITIPSYFTPSQKRMMNDAAELAGLSVL